MSPGTARPVFPQRPGNMTQFATNSCKTGALVISNNFKGLLLDDEADVSREPSPCGSCEENGVVLPTHNNNNKVTVATQTGAGYCPEDNVNVLAQQQQQHQHQPSQQELSFRQDKMTYDPHCYECKVRYRDPKPRDLVMYLHAWKYRGPGWSYETELPDWCKIDWCEPED